MSATQMMMSKQTDWENIIITNLFYFRVPCERTVGTGDSAVPLSPAPLPPPVMGPPLPLLPPVTCPLPPLITRALPLPPVTRPLPPPPPVSAPSAISRRRTGTKRRTGGLLQLLHQELPQCNYSLLILEENSETHRER